MLVVNKYPEDEQIVRINSDNVEQQLESLINQTFFIKKHFLLFMFEDIFGDMLERKLDTHASRIYQLLLLYAGKHKNVLFTSKYNELMHAQLCDGKLEVNNRQKWEYITDNAELFYGGKCTYALAVITSVLLKKASTTSGPPV